MDIGKRALSMATALVLGAAIVGLTAEPAAAEKKKPTQTTTEKNCSLPREAIGPPAPPSQDDYEFYSPGDLEVVVDANGQGHIMECQKDGTWTKFRTEAPAPQRPAGAGRVPSRVIELAP